MIQEIIKINFTYISAIIIFNKYPPKFIEKTSSF